MSMVENRVNLSGIIQSQQQEVLDITPTQLLDLVTEYSGTLKILVTKEIADAILALNAGNRPWITGWAEELADRMASGRWKRTGEPFIIARQGAVNEGQHRAKAISICGIPQVIDITFGVDRDAFDVTGVGRTRSAAHVLAIAGHAANATRAASISNLLIRYSRYLRGEASSLPKASGNISRGAGTVAHDAIRRFMDKMAPEIATAIKITEGKKGFLVLRNAVGGAAHVITSRHNPRLSAIFWEAVMSGVNLSDDSPALRLRERLQANAAAKAKYGEDEKLALTLKAWLAFSANKPVRELRVRMKGPQGEDFPRVPVNLPNVDLKI